MKKALIILFAVLVIFLVYLSLQGNREERIVQQVDMPWQIEINPQGDSRVFGITLGETTLEQLNNSWKQFHPEIGLFTSRKQPQRLEAYLGNRRMGIFDAKIILGLDAPAEQLTVFSTDQINIKPMPSGDYKQELSEANLYKAYQLPVNSITYIPKVKYDAMLMERYFKAPQDTITMENGAAFWLYPDQGLAALLDPDGKEVFHYVVPEKFKDLLQRLELEVVEVEEDGLPAN